MTTWPMVGASDVRPDIGAPARRIIWTADGQRTTRSGTSPLYDSR
jgi:hypothetical protein